MLSIEDSIFMIIITGALIVGLLGNGFIGLVTCIDWVKKKKLTSIDYIFTSLAFSRISVICILEVDMILQIFYPDVSFASKIRVVNNLFWVLGNHSSSWFGTCLSVFYLLKIANFSHPLFLWLKWRIDRLTVPLLLLCCIISLLTFLALVMIVNSDDQLHITEEHNITELLYVSEFRQLTIFNIFGFMVIVPFAMSLISLFLLILSLWRHTKQVKHNAAGSRDPSTEAHVRAMTTVTSFVFLLFVYYLSYFLMASSYIVREKKLAVLFGETIAILYPTGHSLILLLGSNKLRQTSARMLMRVKTACMMQNLNFANRL
ncbi:taste receptor type 2 member 8 [Echinops telfairi]|uniref:Taste receptor type 2 n=1 Tax=Echinops telfairi TaxID=9371 RepID=A0ABM0J9B3_ECHTE|nr:taste receptor type 2 member 8 [Echinops telfairi]